MGKLTYEHAKQSFHSGVLSPSLLGRHDIKAYESGLRSGVNWTIAVNGGLKRRPGQTHLADLTVGTRLMPFQFGPTQRYIIGIVPGGINIFLTTGALAWSVAGMPWDAFTMWKVRYTQQFDTAFLVDGDGIWPMKKLVRTGALTFAVSDFAFELGEVVAKKYCPYFKFADPSVQMTPSAVSGLGITLTLSAAHWINAPAPNGHVNTWVRYRGKQVYIVGVTSPTVAVGNVGELLPGTTAHDDWEEEVFSGIYGYATAICLHSRRLFIAGPRDLPNFIWGSRANAYFNFDDGTGLDDEAIGFAILQRGVSKILHLHSAGSLLTYTDAGVGYSPEGLATPLTPAEFDVRFRIPYAAGDIQPEVFDNSSVYVQDNGKAVRGVFWSESDGGYTDEEVSLLSEQVLAQPRDMSVIYGTTEQRENYLYIVNMDGTLAVCVAHRGEQVRGWIPWVQELPGAYYSVIALGNDVFFVMYRPNLATTGPWRLERLDPAAMLDCTVHATSATPQTVWGGFGLFAGGTVRVVSEHFFAWTPDIREQSVYDLGHFPVSAGGTITLPYASRQIQVGFGFYPSAELLPIELSTAEFGSTMSMKRKKPIVTVRLRDTRHIRINGKPLYAMQINATPAFPPAMMTGKYRRLNLGQGRDESEIRIVIDQTQNLPATLLSVAVRTVF